MEWYKQTLEFPTNGKGMYKITAEIQDVIRSWEVEEGILHLFIQHTSASLVASESYDPTARQDLEAYMDRIAPENEPYYPPHDGRRGRFPLAYARHADQYQPVDPESMAASSVWVPGRESIFLSTAAALTTAKCCCAASRWISDCPPVARLASMC